MEVHYIPVSLLQVPPTATSPNSPSLMDTVKFTAAMKASSRRVETKEIITESKTFNSFHHGLGLIGIATIFCGSLLFMGALAFLVFLWTAEGDDGGASASRIWRWILLNQWLTQSITLSSVLIRIFVAAQASICTSLVASILLERHGIPLSRVAQVSVTRSINDGPLRLAWFFVTKGRSTSTVLGLLTTVLFIVSIAIQFSSTILVSDLSSSSLVGNVVNQPLPVDYEPNLRTIDGIEAQQILEQNPKYAQFGEWAGQNPTPSKSGLSDTGVLRRAFVPTTSNTLQTLRRYEGKGDVLNSRIICLPPEFTTPLVVYYFMGDGGNIKTFISGNFSHQQSLERVGLQLPPNCDGVDCTADMSFNCTAPVRSDHITFNSSSFMLCLPGNSVDSVQARRILYMRGNPILNFTSVMLLWGSGNNKFGWANAMDRPTDAISRTSSLTLSPANGIQIDEWLNINTRGNFSLNVTVCYSQTSVDLADIALHTDRNLETPVVGREIISGSRISNSTAMRRMLGVTRESLSPAERGIFILDKLENSTETNTTFFYTISATTEMWYEATGVGSQVSLTENMFGVTTANTNPELQDIFTRALVDTQRPASALQAFFTAITSSTMALNYPRLDIEYPASVVASTSLLVPRQFRGLVVVSSILFVHLVCVAIITTLFIRQTRYSAQGDYWHAVAQLQGPATQRILEDGRQEHITDEVAEAIAREVNDPMVVVSESRSSGRIQFVSLDRKMR